jgi:uncharacterized protein with PIN domain
VIVTFLDKEGREVTQVFRCKQCKEPLTEVSVRNCSRYLNKHRHARCVACDGVLVCVRVPETARA